MLVERLQKAFISIRKKREQTQVPIRCPLVILLATRTKFLWIIIDYIGI